jgi:predicted alpha/beta superfamily hydrolase
MGKSRSTDRAGERRTPDALERESVRRTTSETRRALELRDTKSSGNEILASRLTGQADPIQPALAPPKKKSDAKRVPHDDFPIFQNILSGKTPVAAGLREVAGSGGWPMRTPTGWLFAVEWNGPETLRLAGEHNGWKPEAMHQAAGVAWLDVPASAAIGGYKLVTPSGAYVADPLARRYRYDDNGEMSLGASSGAHFERWLDVGNASVLPRTVRVWVPPERPTHHLYAQDGQNLFGPGNTWGLESKLGKNTLVVGIDHTHAHRFNDYTHVPDLVEGKVEGGNSEAYAKLVMETLRPRIEAEYGKSEVIGLIGSSLGGTVSYRMDLDYRDYFDMVTSMSGNFTWGAASGDSLLDRFGAAGPSRRTLYYVDSGGTPGRDERDNDNYAGSLKMAELLKKAGGRVAYFHEAGGQHDERTWGKRVARPITLFESLKKR